MDTISREDLKAKLDRGDPFLLVETLPPESYEESHLPGAVNLPPDRIRHDVEELLPDKSRTIIVYCGSPSCDASEKAGRALEEMGYESVLDYAGGKSDWIDAGLPTEGEAEEDA